MLKIETGIKKRAIKTILYGPEGIGKSTLASQFPNPLFIDTENGTSTLDVRRVICNKSWDELISIVNEVISEPSIAKTLVIDSADWAEQLAEDDVCQKNRVASIEAISYGKGYTFVADNFSKLLKLLDKLIELGINVVFTAHAKPRKFELPEEAGQFDRYEMKLSRQVAPLIKEWCDMLLFCNYKTYVVSTENNTKKAQGGKRVMYTTHHPCWDAKNRFSLPEELDMGFRSIEHLFSNTEPKKGLKAQENTAKPTQIIKSRPLVDKVKSLLKEANISEESFKKLVESKGHYKADVPLDDYSDDFISRWVLTNFKKIETAIKNGGNK